MDVPLENFQFLWRALLVFDACKSLISRIGNVQLSWWCGNCNKSAHKMTKWMGQAIEGGDSHIIYIPSKIEIYAIHGSFVALEE